MYGTEIEADVALIEEKTSTEKSNNVLEEILPFRTTRSVTIKRNIDQCAVSEEIQNEDGIMLDDNGETVVELDEDEQEPTTFSANMFSEEDRKLQRKNQLWSPSETNRFYQGLKEHGKNFDQVSKFMFKYKINRDKMQIQKYYFNLFKAFRAILKVSEDELRFVPRDAKELFIVINGCEYKQKTAGSKICPDAFKQLLFNGFATVKLKNRRLVVKTPVCKALRQFFKYDEKFANIPKQLTLKLIPGTPEDKDYVLSCEQNPFLFIQMDMNDSLETVFNYLKLKWLPKYMNADKIPDDSLFLPEFKLLNAMPQSFPKLIVRHSNEAQRRLSLKNLVQYCEDRNDGSTDEQMESVPSISGLASPTSSNHGTFRKKTKSDVTPTSIVVDSCVIPDYHFRQELLNLGLTKTNVKGMSALHLYLIAGMQNELKFKYSISNLPKKQTSVWDLFVSFVKRDYLWYGTDYMIHGTTHAHRKKKKLRQKKKKEAKELEETKTEETAAIVDDEMLGFLQQWNSMSKTSARLHQPEIDVAGSKEVSQEAILDSPMKSPEITPQPVKPVLSTRPRSLINRKRRAIEQIQESPSIQNGPVTTVPALQTDFSFLQPDQPSTSTGIVNQPHPTDTMNMLSKIDNLDNTQNTIFPCLDRTIDGSTLQRALTDEFSNQIGLMAQQNSVDYCRQFEDFVNYFQSPHKASKL
uniref:Myb-like domain-containing protein n=2 Tax=Panagrolaimus sp. JU765 TaxID=591449 RepID=A0AC34PUH1_9BILA